MEVIEENGSTTAPNQVSIRWRYQTQLARTVLALVAIVLICLPTSAEATQTDFFFSVAIENTSELPGVGVGAGGWNAHKIPEFPANQWGLFAARPGGIMDVILSVSNEQISNISFDIQFDADVTQAEYNGTQWKALGNDTYFNSLRSTHSFNSAVLEYDGHQLNAVGPAQSVSEDFGFGRWTGDGTYGITDDPFALTSKSTGEGIFAAMRGAFSDPLFAKLSVNEQVSLLANSSIGFSTWFDYTNGTMDFHLGGTVGNVRAAGEPVPEPGTLLLFGTAILGASMRRRSTA